MSPDVKSVTIDEYLIYFLIDDDAIVYIGKTTEGGLFGRLRDHQKDKRFDSYFVIANIEADEHAIQMERGFISLIRPKYNKAESRVNMQAIMKVIKYLTSGEKSKAEDALTLQQAITRLQASIRADQSNLRKGNGVASTIEARLERKNADLKTLESQLEQALS